MIILSLITAFAITLLVVPSIVNVSREKKLFDEPNQRRLNKVVTPTMGGIAIYIGFTVSSMLFLDKDSPHELRTLWVATLMMLFIGIKDDILIIAPSRKMIVQVAAALILVIPGNFRIEHSYGLFPGGEFHPAVAIPLSVLMILLLINAYNLIDGIDGLAGSLALLTASVLGSWFALTGHTGSAILCFAFCGSLPAFLYYNIRGGKNKIFMGDTGSLVIGVFLAAMAIRFNELNAAATGPWRVQQAPLLVLAVMIVPVTDTLRVFTIRLMEGRPPFSPDMNHLHHLLIRMGMRHIQATALLLLCTAIFVLLALTAMRAGLAPAPAFLLMLIFSFSAAGLLSFLSRRYADPSAAINRYEPKTIPLRVVKNEMPAVTGTAAEPRKPAAGMPGGHLIRINSSLRRTQRVAAGKYKILQP